MTVLSSENTQDKHEMNPLAECGRVHSIETMGTVDGPGTRLVVFTQGCPFRCKYCHNPETWGYKEGTIMRVQEIMDIYERNRPFYRKGGITCTGGEPLAQPRFVGAIFKAAHEDPQGRIHTCLDSSGATFNPRHPEYVSDLLDHTDLVLLDIKHSDPKGHMELVKGTYLRPRAFGDELCRRKIPVLIRHVVVPGITDQVEELKGIGRIIGDWDNVVGLDLLPYHKMGVPKYEALKIAYPLEDVPAMDASRIPELRQIVMQARQERMIARRLAMRAAAAKKEPASQASKNNVSSSSISSHDTSSSQASPSEKACSSAVQA